MGANFQKIRFQVTNSSKMEFVDITLWPWESILLFWALHLIAIEIFQNAIVMNIGKLEKKKIEIKGGHLDSLSAKDKAFIVFNRLCIPFLSYFLFRSFCNLKVTEGKFLFLKQQLLYERIEEEGARDSNVMCDCENVHAILNSI